MSENNRPKVALPNLYLDIKLAKLALPEDSCESAEAYREKVGLSELESESA